MRKPIRMPSRSTNSSTPKSLKVGFVFDDSLDTNDGVAQYVKRVGAWLEAQGLQVSYLVGQSRINKWHNGSVYSLARNLPVRWAGNRLSIPIFSSGGRIKEVLTENQFDILHVQFPYSPFMAQLVINHASAETAC